jgi:hypothetical protein
LIKGGGLGLFVASHLEKDPEIEFVRRARIESQKNFAKSSHVCYHQTSGNMPYPNPSFPKANCG